MEKIKMEKITVMNKDIVSYICRLIKNANKCTEYGFCNECVGDYILKNAISIDLKKKGK